MARSGLVRMLPRKESWEAGSMFLFVMFQRQPWPIIRRDPRIQRAGLADREDEETDAGHAE